MTAERQTIKIPPIMLEWSDWYSWEAIEKADKRRKEGIRLPEAPGVYEVRYADSAERLTIGMTTGSLDHRLRKSLVKGHFPHSAGEDIRAEEDTSRIVLRWASTDRPAAVEEELKRQYVERFGKPPKHTDH